MGVIINRVLSKNSKVSDLFPEQNKVIFDLYVYQNKAILT